MQTSTNRLREFQYNCSCGFSVPSASMCPTICIGERIVADMHAYQSRPPQRGDLIMLQHPSSRALFIKRVIALPGDTVAPGPDGCILISGQPFVPLSPCAQTVDEKGASAHVQRANPGEYTAFHSAVIPSGTYFVVGDNLGNSFDSRIPEFGAVTADMIRGKPLFLYWSPTSTASAARSDSLWRSSKIAGPD